ncbi:hypothetical protein NLI96_g13173 [Meripilus lineatus]|uniref:ABC transmembrane type-1 domain-containing protein n=1 Tax=Meripilus lineatus TaxID=2056292 RepID=A0AAD5Y6Y9_9APHY|nr:hypothetical protein NLI96_g13173 [Physisporinus lineatus]
MIRSDQRVIADVQAKLPDYKQPTDDQWRMIFSTTPSTCVVAGGRLREIDDTGAPHIATAPLSRIRVVAACRRDVHEHVTAGLRHEAYRDVCALGYRLTSLPGYAKVSPFEFVKKRDRVGDDEDEDRLPFETRLNGLQQELLNTRLEPDPFADGALSGSAPSFQDTPEEGGYLSVAGRPIPLGPKTTAFITFTMFEAAYYAEIVRSGFKAVNKGQYEGAKALGLSTATMYGSVILPQVLRATAPIIVTQTIILFQDTALVYVLSLHDFLGTAAQIAQRDGKLTEFYTFVAVVYLVLCSAGSELAERLRRKTPGTVRRSKSFRTLGLPRP